MKILRFSNVPDVYFNFEKIAEGLSSYTSLELYNYFLELGAIVPKNFSQAMKLLGWNCIDVLIHPTYQKRWCNEHKIKFESNAQSIKSMIAHHKPDLVYVERCYWGLISPEFRAEIKREFPFLKAIVLWVGNQTCDSTLPLFKGYDVIFNITTKMANQFRKINKFTHCVRAGVDVLPSKSSSFNNHDCKKHLFTFLGSSGYGMADHYNRISLLNFLIEKTPLEAWVKEPIQTKKKLVHDEYFFKRLFDQPTRKLIQKTLLKDYEDVKPYVLKYLSGESYESIHQMWLTYRPLHYLNHPRVYPPVYGSEYDQIIQQSQITLNLHTDEPGHGGNFRVFEVGKIGTCLLTDRANFMKDFVDIDKEIVGFDTPEEAVDKFNYLKDKPKLCKEIGSNLQKNILSNHTIYHRCQEIKSYIEKYLEVHA